MNTGGPLYAAGGVDNKPPVVFWLYSVVYRAFGLYDLTAVHLVKVLVVLVTAFFVALTARRIAGEAAGWLAALLYIAFTAAGYGEMAAANTEVLMMLPATLSLWLMLEGRWAASGAVLAVAVLTKQVGALQLALYPAAMLLGQVRMGGVARAAAGFGGAVGSMLLLLAATGSLSGFWHWAVLALVTNYGPSAWTGGQLLSNLTGSGLPEWLEAAPLLLLPAAIGLAARQRVGPDEKLVRAWLVTSTAAAIAGGHFFGHYFIQVVGPLAVLAAVALVEWRRPVLAIAAAVLLAVPAAYFTFNDYLHAGLRQDAVSAYIAAHSSAGDRIFVWGNVPQLYVYSGRVPATRFPGFLRGFQRGADAPPPSWDTTPDVWPALAADFRAHPPRYLVDTSTANWAYFGYYPMSRFPVLPGIVASEYAPLTVVEGVTIYRLR